MHHSTNLFNARLQHDASGRLITLLVGLVAMGCVSCRLHLGC